MSLRLFNTASRSLETFSPKDPSRVTIYTCGPTVYSAPHLGNFSAYLYWDLLLRTLLANHYTPYRVLNLTDVGHLTSDADSGEDKLEKGARKEGKTVWEIADHYISLFRHDFARLRLLEPTHWARATDYINESKALVEALIANGYTYETEDGLYFDTSRFPAYPDFARLDLKNLKAGARVEFSSAKKHPSDFAIWKFIKAGETHAMRWDFLGRPGYPGWHLECSTIIHTLLGEPIDIHTGGIDHIPVHHTNEIAQTFGAFKKPLAHFWLHCNFLTIDGQKISKSLGNTITLNDLEAKGFSPFDFKLWLYQGHYRSERNFTFSDLSAAKARRLVWRNKAALALQKSKILSADKTSETSPKNPAHSSLLTPVIDALNDDLNSPAAFAYLDSVLDSLTLDDFHALEDLFALDLIPKDKSLELAPLIERRNLARQKKDFATADALRDDLAHQGFSLLDSDQGTFWQLLS